MGKIAIVTDSCASIPDTIIESLDISWVPYYIHRGSEVLRDLVNVQPEPFYQWLPTAKELPTTASPGPGDYLSLYERLFDQDGVKEIVSVHMTSKGSAAFQAATSASLIAAEQLPGLTIEVVDSLNVSMCHGWMVIEAARAALAGRSLAEVVEEVNRLIPIARMIQTADTLKYLYLGGRIGKAKHLVGTLLNIKPLISMEDGVIVTLGQARSRNRAYQMMVEHVESAVGTMGKIKIAYTHASASEEIRKIRHMIEKRFTCVETIITELSPALGVHTGPGTAGICYYPVN